MVSARVESVHIAGGNDDFEALLRALVLNSRNAAAPHQSRGGGGWSGMVSIRIAGCAVSAEEVDGRAEGKFKLQKLSIDSPW